MNQYKPICPEQYCTGCMACVNSCSHNAIVLEENYMGFKYPKIDTQKCVDCGLCSSVCPEINRRKLVFPKQCYAAVMKDANALQKSASGGAAAAFSAAIIEKGGVVCGCTGENLPNARHIIIDKIEDVSRLNGSKYVESEISANLYRQIKSYLVKGITVLFIGTGCQVAGLQNFLKKSYDNLITIDLVCHGVPSRKMLAENMAIYPYIIKESVKFREKKKPAEPNGEAIRYGWFYRTSRTEAPDDELHEIPWDKDPYLAAFMDCVSFRESCYNCRYAYPARQSDLTICDFWGLKHYSRLFGSMGVSAIFCNNSRGNELIAMVNDKLELEERQAQEAICGNGQLMRPSAKPWYYVEFIKAYRSGGLVYAVKSTIFRHREDEERSRKKMRIIMMPYTMGKGMIKVLMKPLAWLKR